MILNKKLTLKLNSLNGSMTDLPNTPVEQTLSTPTTSYFNPIYNHLNESDDVLMDGESSRQYTINFTNNFDQLVLSIYSNILSLPTTTPFAGNVPPSGLVSKVANETMNAMLQSPNVTYDHNSLISTYGKNQSYYPIFLQLIRRRLLDLCNNVTTSETSISFNASGLVINNLRQTSISNLSLNELNINNYSKGDKSAVNLRKHSLTRNNSYSNSWLHIGNLANIKPQHMASTESLQDFVPQSFINRSAVSGDYRERSNSDNSQSNPLKSAPEQLRHDQSSLRDQMGPSFLEFVPKSSHSAQSSQSSFDYQTPPSSQKSSIQYTPPDNVQQYNDYDDFHFFQNFPPPGAAHQKVPLTINTDHANADALNALNGNARNMDSLDSPFMSASSDEGSYFTNGFPSVHSNNSSPTKEDLVDKINAGNYTLNEKKRDSLKMKRGIH